MSASASPRNPFRPPSWRWDRACALHDGSAAPSRGLDDRYVALALRFRRALAGARDGAGLAALEARMPALFWAHELRHAADGSWRQARSEVEARILAGQDRRDLCARTGLAPRTLAAYERVFFDVAGRLARRSFILHHVIGPRAHSGLREADADGLWKLFGYLGGPAVLDALAGTGAPGSRPRTPAEVAAFLRDAISETLRRKTLVAACGLSVNGLTQVDVIGLYLKQLELAGGGPGGGGPGSGGGVAWEVLTAHLEATLQRMPLQYAGRVAAPAPVAAEPGAPGLPAPAFPVPGAAAVEVPS